MGTIPPVVVYSGHMFEAGGAEEPALAARVAATVAEVGTAEGFGPLACGGDILFAEALLAAGAKLHVVLPFAEDDFIQQSVLCGGESWLPRYRTCLAAASSLHFATPGAYVNDDNQFAYGTRMAMGLATLRAREIGAEVVPMAIFSPTSTSYSKTGLAGTKADAEAWRRVAREPVVIDPGPVGRTLRFPTPPPPEPDARRAIRSILFADYKGFAGLGERELPLFMRTVMGGIGEVLDAFAAHVEFRNTWGDAVYAIVDEPPAAARIALVLQDRLANLPADLASPGHEAGMRIGLHYGPIYKGTDRITRDDLWYGGEVNRTARIEPVTPVGGVYCTETFAAALMLEGEDRFALERVGETELAKGFGAIVLYRLTHGR